MKIKLIQFLLILSSVVKAQNGIPELITDRPDQTESAATVPHKSLQIETGFVLESEETDLIEKKAFAYNTTLLRYGLLDKLELRLGIEYLGEKTSIKNTDTTHAFSGLSPLNTGLKVEISEEDGWKPEIAFLAGVAWPFTANDHFKHSNPEGNARFSFSHTLSKKLSLGYNLGIEWEGETDKMGYFYSVVLGVSITNNLGAYAESYGLLPQEGDAEHLLDAGLTYLVLPNLQIDVSGGIGLTKAAIDGFISCGLSYRIPK